MHSAPSLITAISYGMGLVGLAGASFAYFRSSLTKNTIAILRDNNRALEDRVNILDKANADLAKQLHEQVVTHTAEIAALRQELSTFKDLPLGKLMENQQAGLEYLKALTERQNIKPRTKAR